MEHRWGYRYSLDTPARVTDRDGTVTSGRLRDVSLTGALLQTDAPLQMLSPLQLTLPLDGFSLQLKAWVVRHASEGYGLEWHDGETLDLDLLLEQVLMRLQTHRRRDRRMAATAHG